MYDHKYLPCTATQSFISSPAGSFTTSLRSIPEFKEALACLCRLNFSVPDSNFFLGRKVYKINKQIRISFNSGLIMSATQQINLNLG